MKKRIYAIFRKIKKSEKIGSVILKGSTLRLLAVLLVIFLFLGAVFYITKEKEIEAISLEETANYMNSLEGSGQKTIWTNKESFCGRLESKCFWGSEIPKDTDLDYLVFFVNQVDSSGLDSGELSNLVDFPAVEYSAGGKLLYKKIEKSKVLKVKNLPQELVPVLPQFSFAILGDSQRWPAKEKQADQFESILEKVKNFHPDFILAMGDLTSMYACREAQKCRGFFERWRDEVSSIAPVYPAVGNHDYENGAVHLWQEVFQTPQNGPAELGGTAFSFDYKNSHFVFLNSEKNSEQLENSSQIKWMNNDLKNTGRGNIFVVNHRPNYPSESYTQKHKWETFFENNILAYFSGHVHVYCHRQIPASLINNNNNTEEKIINHFIIGNSGSKPMPVPENCEQSSVRSHFAIVSVKGLDVTVKIYDFNGNELDAINLKNERYYD
jgi:hypothetical protein